MSHTCLGCAHYERLKVRNQWVTLCRITHQTAPMVACRWFLARFETQTKVEIGAELL